MSMKDESEDKVAATTATAIIDPGHDYTGPPPVLQSSPNAKAAPKMVLVKKLSFEGTTAATIPTKCSMFGISSGATTLTTTSAAAAANTSNNPVMVFKLPTSKAKTTPTKPIKLCLTSASPVPIKPKAMSSYTPTPTINSTALLQLLASQIQQPSVPVKLPASATSMATVSKQGPLPQQPTVTQSTSLQVVTAVPLSL